MFNGWGKDSMRMHEFEVINFDPYFFVLTQKSKQKKSSQKNPAHRTGRALPGFLAGPRAHCTQDTVSNVLTDPYSSKAASSFSLKSIFIKIK